MSKPSTQPLVDWRELSKLERKITADERGGIMHRWNYGREVLKAKAGRKQLPDGMIASLVAAGDRNGKKITETEIQRRVRLATVYTSDQQVRQIMTDLGTWSAIIEAGFPEVTVDEAQLEPVDDVSPPDAWEQLTLLPGFRPVVKIGGKDKPIADMTVPEAIAYREKSRATHESYGKWLSQIELTVDIVLDGWDGDPEAKALDAYKRGIST